MTEAWDPAPEVVREIRSRLLGDESVRDVAEDYPVYPNTIKRYARGDRGEIETEIGPVQSVGRGSDYWFPKRLKGPASPARDSDD